MPSCSDPDLFPAQFPFPGGLSDSGLHRMLDEVCRSAASVVGLDVTAFEAPAERGERTRLAEIAADALMPLL